MAEYIERGELLKELERFPHLKTAESVVRSMPKADVVEERHGEWLENDGDFWVLCTACGTEVYDDQEVVIHTYHYCPFCGAKMSIDGGDTE